MFDFASGTVSFKRVTTQILIGGRCKEVSVNGNFVVDYVVYHGEISNKTSVF